MVGHVHDKAYNRELGNLFHRMAGCYRYLGPDQRFRAIAYENASRTLLGLKEDISVYAGDIKKLEHLNGIGESIAEKIIEYLHKGKISSYDELKTKVPEGLLELMDITGFGPATVKFLHKKCGISNREELIKRVARKIAEAELKWGSKEDAFKWENEFFEMMIDLLFLPNSPTLMNAGTPLNQLSACFVLPIEDSLEEIFTSLKYAALIQQSGGGTGFNFSHLRPKDDPLTIINGTSSGPVSFMKVFNAATEHIRHGGKRRGANMGILNINHPDIEEFILSKREEGRLGNFNISVGISDAFMEAVEKNKEWKLVNPRSKKTVKKISAVKLWQDIIENAWYTGDPGLIFLDTINADNPLLHLGQIEATNPCGEVPLLPYESCNLGSINLAKLVDPERSINWEKLETVIHHAVRFLDNVIEVNNFIITPTARIVQQNRKIGLGIMGWADLLILQEIPYDSEDAIELAAKLMQFINNTSMEASEELAKERGCFPNWEKSIYYPDRKMRNATRLSIAPTGTISIIADTSSSIEPLFALAYERKNVLDGATLPEMNRYFLDYIKEYDLYSQQLVEAVKNKGDLSSIENIPVEVKNIFKTAHEISPTWHLKHQVVFQQYVDNAVSKTINLPESTSIDDIAMIYRMAWKQKTKGITVYRYHSKSKQVLEQGINPCAVGCSI